MNTPNPQQDAAIEATLSDAYARIQDMIKLQSELDPDNTDSTNYIHQIRARIDELGITDRMREYPPVAHILKYRDTIVEILAATEASVRQLEESKKLPISNEKRQVKIVWDSANIQLQLLRYHFALIQITAIAKYRHDTFQQNAQRWLWKGSQFYQYILGKTF